MKTIPVKKAKDICRELGLEQIIIVGIKGNWTSVATYGETIENCKDAAKKGNLIKEYILGWPKHMCNAIPKRVKNKENKDTKEEQYDNILRQITTGL